MILVGPESEYYSGGPWEKEPYEEASEWEFAYDWSYADGERGLLVFFLR